MAVNFLLAAAGCVMHRDTILMAVSPWLAAVQNVAGMVAGVLAVRRLVADPGCFVRVDCYAVAVS